MAFTINNGADSPLESIYATDYWIVNKWFGDRLWLWGNAYGGILGDNTQTAKSSLVQTITGGANWRVVSCGEGNTAAIKTDGTLWLWGENVFGQLGDNSIANKSSPVQTISTGTNWQSVSCDKHTAAIKTDGSLWLWGRNIYGQLGDNTTTPKSSPVQTVAGGTNWKQVTCGGNHTAAVKSDGTVWVWGGNGAGQLGDNTAVNKSSPIQTIAGGTNWKSVACGYGNIAAIKVDGTLWVWGSNNFGQLGDTTIANKSSPIQTISGGTNWKQVAWGDYHIAAIKTDGSMWLWGRDTYGQLGDNTTIHKSSPVQTIAGGINWKSVTCGWGHTAAISINNINTTGT